VDWQGKGEQATCGVVNVGLVVRQRQTWLRALPRVSHNIKSPVQVCRADWTDVVSGLAAAPRNGRERDSCY